MRNQCCSGAAAGPRCSLGDRLHFGTAQPRPTSGACSQLAYVLNGTGVRPKLQATYSPRAYLSLHSLALPL
eukprot:5860698-Alexandrium_andersonii.AAC.1